MNKSPKIPIKYECIKCNYITVNKKDYNKHLTTRKHLMEINGNKMEMKYPQCNICSKTFKSSSGLWKHKQKCIPLSNDVSDNTVETNNNDAIVQTMMQLITQNQQLFVSNQQFKELIVEQQHENQKQQNL